MNELKRTVEEKVKAISGAVRALTGILAAFAQFNETVKKAFDSLGPIAVIPRSTRLLGALRNSYGGFLPCL
jgi:hypothetical protein